MHRFRLNPLKRGLATAFLTLAAGQAMAGACPSVVTSPEAGCDLSTGSLTLDSPSDYIIGRGINGVTVTGNADSIVSHGQISGSPAGVAVNAGASLNLLSNGSGGNISGTNYGVLVNGTINQITNQSSIYTFGSANNSIAVQSGGIVGTVINDQSGSIPSIIVSDGGAISKGITTAGRIDAIINSGLIFKETGTAIAQTTSGHIRFIGNTNSGVIIGGDTAISGTWTLNITNDGLIAGATAIQSAGNNFYMQNNGIVHGGLFLSGPDSTVQNNGLIWLPDGPVANSLINGTYTQWASGALYINATSAGAYGYGNLYVSGTATVNGVVQVVLATNHTIAAGQTLSNVVGAYTSLTGTPVIKDTSLNLDFVPVQTAKTLSLTAVAAPTQVAPATDNAVIDYCSQLGSNCSLPTTAAGIQQLAQNIEEPVIVGGTQAATMTVMRDISRIIQARHEANIGLSSGDGFYADEYLWMRPFGSWGEQKERNGVAGYDSRTGGIMIGTDGLIGEKTRAGLALTYAKINLDGNSSVQPETADVTIWNLLGYGSYAIDDVTDVNFHAGIGKNSNKGERTITGLTTTGRDPVASSRYDGQVATLGVGLGRTLALSPQTRFIPTVRADYVWVKDDGYTEDGASPFNLQVDSQTASSLVFAVDGKIRHDVAKGLSLFANLGVGYDVINDLASINALIAGQPGGYTTYYGIDQSPWLTRAGLALVGNPTPGLEYGVYYDAEYRSDYLNQTASAKLRWAF